MLHNSGLCNLQTHEMNHWVLCEFLSISDHSVDIFRCVQNREATVELFGSLSIIVEIPEVSEDCLYLNIYTPVKPGEDAKLPVSHNSLVTIYILINNIC